MHFFSLQSIYPRGFKAIICRVIELISGKKKFDGRTYEFRTDKDHFFGEMIKKDIGRVIYFWSSCKARCLTNCAIILFISWLFFINPSEQAVLLAYQKAVNTLFLIENLWPCYVFHGKKMSFLMTVLDVAPILTRLVILQAIPGLIILFFFLIRPCSLLDLIST